jgi:hypothetical protein
MGNRSFRGDDENKQDQDSQENAMEKLWKNHSLRKK